MLVKGRPRLVVAFARKISDPQTPISSATRKPPDSVGVRGPAVDGIDGEESTEGSRGLLASSIAEHKALRSLPALQAPRPVESGRVWPSRPRPRGLSSRSACAGLPAVVRWAFPRGRADALSKWSGRHPMPPRCSRHPSSLRILRRTRPCLPLMGSPCVFAREPRTALDFRSGAGPMQVDDATNRGLIHRKHPARPACRCRPVPQRHGGIPKPASAEMREWDGSPFHF